MKKVMTPSQITMPDATSYQDNLLAVALIDAPSQGLFADASAEVFSTEERRAVAAFLATHPGKSVADTPDPLKKYDTYVKILLLKADARYADWNDHDRYQETARLLRQTVNEHKKQTRDQLINQLRDAEEQGDDEKATTFRTQLNALIKEISRG